MILTRSLALTATLTALLLSGCHVVEHKDGKNKNVDIGTPFGSMQVKTNESADTTAIGITQYPGSVTWKDKDSDNGNANVNMSFGGFHLGVKAASFQSSDPQDKIIAFYKKDLARYGDVLTCKGDQAIGTPSRTSQGLTCSDDQKNSHTHFNSSNSIELKAGSKTHQHIVGIDLKGDNGTKIGLVSLDLPNSFGSHDDKDSE